MIRLALKPHPVSIWLDTIEVAILLVSLSFAAILYLEYVNHLLLRKLVRMHR